MITFIDGMFSLINTVDLLLKFFTAIRQLNLDIIDVL